MSVFAIGDEDTVLGITLAGGRGVAVRSTKEAREALDSVLDRKDVRLVLVTREWAEAMRERIDRLRMTTIDPVVLEIPGKDLKPPDVPLEEMVSRAVGIDL